MLLDDQVHAPHGARPAAISCLPGAAHARDVGQEVGLARRRLFEFGAVCELVLIARALQYAEAKPQLAMVEAKRSMLTNGAIPVTVATIRCEGNRSCSVKTPFGRGRSDTESPSRDRQSRGVSAPCGTSSTKSSRVGSCGDETIE